MNTLHDVYIKVVHGLIIVHVPRCGILSQDEHRIEEITKFEQNVSDHENQKNCENSRNSNHG